MTTAAQYLQQIQDVASGGFDVNELGAFCDRVRRDETNAPEDAVLWGITNCDDPTTIWWLASIAGTRRLVAALEPLRARAQHLPERKGLRDYRRDVSDALVRLQRAADGEPCDCSVANGSPGSEPTIDIESERDDLEAYETYYTVRCRICGSRYRVVQQDSYHYPIFTWRPATTR